MARGTELWHTFSSVEYSPDDRSSLSSKTFDVDQVSPHSCDEAMSSVVYSDIDSDNDDDNTVMMGDDYACTSDSSMSSCPHTDRQVLKSTMISSCMKMVREKVTLNAKKYEGNISLDCDAFSFIITIDSTELGHVIDAQKQLAIKKFLNLFGTDISDTEIPSKPYASKTKDSIFGTNNNYCQHLESSRCHDVLTQNEVLVISSPVKIAVQSQCKKK